VIRSSDPRSVPEPWILPLPSARWLGFVASVLTGIMWAPAVFGAEPTVATLLAQAGQAADAGKHAEAVELATQAIRRQPDHPAAYHLRGRERFCLNQIPESVADFDRHVALVPEQAPRQWERGIALYYAGKYQEGAEQFEKYQTFDGHDVENSVWRFLCMVPLVGVPQAQAVMLPIDQDRRVPMMQVYDLYRGQRKPEEVLQAAREGNPDPVALAGRLFYAHLYLALWYDAVGEPERARQYIDLAAEPRLQTNPRLNRYMWEVARIHQLRRRPAPPPK
jgi:lipoprotein NlpI